MAQKIFCNVCSCSFNEPEKGECSLKSIQVTPCTNCKKGSPENESFCGSYIQAK